jgi:hypothetical protein
VSGYNGKLTKELKIVFTKSKKNLPIFSWLIMWWTKKPYSHVARQVIRRDWGAGYYQASEGNVNYEHESVFYKKHEIVAEYVVMVDPQLEMDIRRACWEDCGKKYGMWQNIGIFLVDIGLFKDTPWKDGRNCSELIYIKVLKKMVPELNRNPDTIKPHHIEDIIKDCFEEKSGKWELK